MLINYIDNVPLVFQIGMKQAIQNMLYQNGEVIYGFFNLAFLISYISLFSYWSVLAWTKYQDEPIATNTEFRLGDDNLGNFTSRASNTDTEFRYSGIEVNTEFRY